MKSVSEKRAFRHLSFNILQYTVWYPLKVVRMHLILAPVGSFNRTATAARQGGSVAASRVDSREFRTADKRG